MSLIERLLNPKKDLSFTPKKFGPTFQVKNKDEIEITTGPLQGISFKIEQETSSCQSRLFLKNKENNQLIGRALFDLVHSSGEVIFWDVMVQAKYRIKGLASVMTKYMLRQLISEQKKIKFMIRMIKLYQPTDTSIKLQNVGIGVIAHRLGLFCEFDLPKILNPLNITHIEILEPQNDCPPSYKIVVRTYPYVLIGFIVDPMTLRPIPSFEIYKEMLGQTGVVEEWIRNKTIVIGNGNYVLKNDGMAEFINCIAADEYEAQFFNSKIQSM
jgi:hypothetical protein